MARLQRQHGFPWLRRLGICLSLPMAGIFLSGTSVLASTDAYCHFSQEAIAQKNRQRQAAFADSPATTPETAQQAYQRLIRQHAQQLQQCRQEHWLQNQAIWLRLYPCDLQPGSLEKVLDRIVNKGYNRVYLEVFYDGRVLLPPDDNPTPWPSVVPEEVELENTDLLEKAIAKGRERGLQVYAWMFTMNFGYSYAQLPDRQEVLARNGKNQTTLEVTGKTGIHAQIGTGNHSEVFIDPYHPLAQRDYAWLVDSVLQRQPDGVLLDYLRYKRGNGENSVVTNVSDLWIHGEASRQALSARADNKKGRELIRRFLDQGYITISDLKALENMYPDEKTPMWQGRWLPAEAKKADMSLSQRQDLLQRQLWYLSVAHAVQGVLDFFEEAIAPIQKRDIPTGAVFFPGGNRPVGEAGFDSRLQAWDRFPESVQWHPMLYAKCGETGCIVDELQRVLEFASNQTEIVPALAGTWGKVTNNRPALEAQMAAIHQAAPEIDSISHFAYSWQEPESDRERKFCNLSP